MVSNQCGTCRLLDLNHLWQDSLPSRRGQRLPQFRKATASLCLSQVDDSWVILSHLSQHPLARGPLQLNDLCPPTWTHTALLLSSNSRRQQPPRPRLARQLRRTGDPTSCRCSTMTHQQPPLLPLLHPRLNPSVLMTWLKSSRPRRRHHKACLEDLLPRRRRLPYGQSGSLLRRPIPMAGMLPQRLRCLL